MDARYHSSTYPGFVPSMGIDNHTVHPWIQAQQIQQPGEQYIHSTIPSYVTQINLPSAGASYTQTRIINYNYVSIVCEERNDIGVISSSCQLIIPTELLDERLIHEVVSTVGLKEIVLLGPHPDSSQSFVNSRNVLIRRAIGLLNNIHSLKKITFSLDLSPITGILEILAMIPDMEEVVLTLPTVCELEPNSMAMLDIQKAFVDGLEYFGRLQRLTIPIELVTSLLLSYLAGLPSLKSLTVKYSPDRPSHHHQHSFPPWSSYRDPAECPGYIFLSHLNFDTREHFQQLSHLDLGVSSSDSSYATLKKLFPQAHIC